MQPPRLRAADRFFARFPFADASARRSVANLIRWMSLEVARAL